MSQSDYLKYKRVATILKVDNNTKKQPPVFGSSVYNDNVEFSLENSVINKKVVLNRLTLNTGNVIAGNTAPIPIWGMDKKVTGCTTFPICNNTNTRTNRVPVLQTRFDPVPQPLNIEKRNEAANLKTECKCVLNSKYTKKGVKKGVCSCVLGRFGIVR
jgi:hypothetical protein